MVSTLTLAAGKKYRLMVFGNRVLMRILGPKREEVTGGWRRLHNEELRKLYALPNIISVIKSKKLIWAVLAARLGGMRNAYRILVGEHEGKISCGRPRRREVNIGMKPREIRLEVVDWIHKVQDSDQWRALVTPYHKRWEI